MSSRIITNKEKLKIRKAAKQNGFKKAAEDFDVNQTTIRSWEKRRSNTNAVHSLLSFLRKKESKIIPVGYFNVYDFGGGDGWIV